MKLFSNKEVQATNEELTAQVIKLTQDINKLNTELNSLKTASTEENKNYKGNEYQELTIDELCEKITKGEI